MAGNTKISWCNHTANLWWGCNEVHEGCDNCYARIMSNRWGFSLWGRDNPRKFISSFWRDLSLFQKKAAECGEVHRVFVGSMMDIFEKSMPLIDSQGKDMFFYDEQDNKCRMTTGDLRDEFFNGIDKFPNLMFLLLTKRPSKINKFIPRHWIDTPPSNVMFGTSIVNQETADILINQLKCVKGKRFLSIEPQLDSIYSIDLNGIDWVIQGGESGHHKRPFNTDWAREIRDLCLRKRIPYFFKQIDQIKPIPEDLKIQQFPSI